MSFTESKGTLGNSSQAVMASRASAKDSLDLFPTPPWATRAFVEEIMWKHPIAIRSGVTIWEPAAGLGHLSDVLTEYYSHVHASDVHDYGLGHAIGSFVGDGIDIAHPPKHGAEWIITNPPFNLAVEFAERALITATCGVALLVRSVWAEGGDRYQRLFAHTPPTLIAQYCERVPMTKGRWNPKASTATSYAWFCWIGDWKNIQATRFTWIKPHARVRYTKADDVARFASREGVAS